jgi:hypothetical protein
MVLQTRSIMLWLKKLNGTTKYVMPYSSCRVNRCLYNRFQLYCQFLYNFSRNIFPFSNCLAIRDRDAGRKACWLILKMYVICVRIKLGIYSLILRKLPDIKVYKNTFNCYTVFICGQTYGRTKLIRTLLQIFFRRRKKCTSVKTQPVA